MSETKKPEGTFTIKQETLNLNMEKHEIEYHPQLHYKTYGLWNPCTNHWLEIKASSFALILYWLKFRSWNHYKRPKRRETGRIWITSGQLTFIKNMCKLENVRYVRDNVANWQLGFFITASLAFSGASGYSEVKSSPGATTKVVWEWLFKG